MFHSDLQLALFGQARIQIWLHSALDSLARRLIASGAADEARATDPIKGKAEDFDPSRETDEGNRDRYGLEVCYILTN
ncbi:MAG: hypothetical protein JOZ30_02070 [Hyphomicrobiales bacterium]|nr:hypothetical protein [Hyphomicrobiales bacterium]